MEHFGPYRLEDVLGQGGMGVVFRAYDTRRERTVALKRLRPELATENGYQERFRRECTYAARLSSPHVVPIHDFGDIEGQLFLDMRLVDGTDLRKLLTAAGTLPPQRSVQLIGHVADALDCAHGAGLIHRDVKPSNVLVTAAKGRDFSYLTDFGIVRTSTGNDSSLTATGKAIGTLTYMAPELFTGGPHDKQVDIYALGCLLYETLTGIVPFEGEGPVLMYHHLNDPPPRPSAVRRELGDHLDAVVARAMAKEPGARFPSAGALAEAADQALARQTAPTSKASNGRVSDVSEEETSSLTRETSHPSTRIFKKVQTSRPRSIRTTAIAVVATVAAVAAIAIGALLYPSNNFVPSKPSRPLPPGPDVSSHVTLQAPSTTNTAIDNWKKGFEPTRAAVSEDLSVISKTAGENDAAAMADGCKSLLRDAGAAQNYVPIPDSEAQEHWVVALKFFIQGSTDCIKAVHDNNGKLLSQAANEIGRAGQETRQVNSRLGNLAPPSK